MLSGWQVGGRPKGPARGPSTMGSRPLSSLRARLFLLVLLTALPVTFLWGYSALQIRQRALLDAESFVLQVARGAVREYEALVQGARQLLPALAANRQVLELDGQGCSREFARLLSVYPQYATLGAIAADGQVFCSSIPFTPPIDASDRLYFREAIASGGVAIGELPIPRHGSARPTRKRRSSKSPSPQLVKPRLGRAAWTGSTRSMAFSPWRARGPPPGFTSRSGSRSIRSSLP